MTRISGMLDDGRPVLYSPAEHDWLPGDLPDDDEDAIGYLDEAVQVAQERGYHINNVEIVDEDND